MILPIESADMHYISFRRKDDTIVWTLEIGKPSKFDIPAWSFTKLCELMQIEYKIEKSYLDQSGYCTYSFIFEGYPHGPNAYRTYEREEIIDAAIEFISFLHNNELL